MPSEDAPLIPAILLAAGLSSRMGAFKPLLTLAGRPLIMHVIDSLAASGRVGPVVVVTGHRAGELATALPPSITAVFNPQFAAGEMLSSLRAGIEMLQRLRPAAPAFLLAFADQPAVLASTLRALVDAHHQSQPPLTLPTFGGKRGHPLILSTSLIPEIAALATDETLRTVVQRHLERATMLAVDDASILEDLDTPEDFARMERRYRQPATNSDGSLPN